MDVLYLVDKGPRAQVLLDTFIEAYRRVDGGRKSAPDSTRLILVVRNRAFLKADDPLLERRLLALDDVSCLGRGEPNPGSLVLDVPDDGRDLGAFHFIAKLSNARVIVCLAPHCRPQLDGWLHSLVQAADLPDVGLAGTSASWESPAAYGVDGYPPFPNPHIRSTCFAVEREAFLTIKGLAPGKNQATDGMLECGPASMTREALAGGLRAIVVSPSPSAIDTGAAKYGDPAVTRRWDVPNADASETFRKGEQHMLAVADSRTDDYLRASPEERRRLHDLAWGPST